jgi:Ran GTPase-activating protein (RanGAP) involved in mRNA processing and transport
LEKLDVSNNSLSAYGCRKITDLFKTNKILKEISLKDNLEMNKSVDLCERGRRLDEKE